MKLNINKVLIGATTLAFLGLQSLNAGALEATKLSNFNSPESVVANKDYIFVANVGTKLDPLNKDGDGYINIINKKDNTQTQVFAKDLNAPKGMKIVGNTLYVVDIDVVYGFDIKTKQQVFKLPIKNSVFLNAIESLDKNTLLISDTGTYKIYKVDLKSKTYATFLDVDKSYGGPNGLLLDKDQLYVVGYDPAETTGGLIYKVNVKSKKIQKLSDNVEQFDGIVKVGNDFLISSWGANLNGYVYKLSNNQLEKLPLEALKGPADMFYDTETKTLLIPEMANNALVKVKF